MHLTTPSAWLHSLLLTAVPSLIVSLTTASSAGAVAAAAAAAATDSDHDHDHDPIPASTRVHWMRQAKAFLHSANGGSPCPHAAFGAAIVNHSTSVMADVNDGKATGGAGGSAGGLGELVCLGVNTVRRDGNPTLHGEIAAINNCTAVLTSPTGPYKLTGVQALDALKGLSLYTTAEACCMCAAAITSGQFAEYIFASSSPDLEKWGWPVNGIRSLEVLEKAPPRTGGEEGRGHGGLGSVNPNDRTRIVQGVLREETDELFGWQFREDGACPAGCVRDARGDASVGGGCVPADQDAEHDEL